MYVDNILSFDFRDFYNTASRICSRSAYHNISYRHLENGKVFVSDF